MAVRPTSVVTRSTRSLAADERALPVADAGTLRVDALLPSVFLRSGV
jgi:hypothetical protein